MISKNKIEEFIRVDHAGERGAVKIYEGQLLALNTLVSDDKLKKTIEEMKVHEKEHCEFFENEKELKKNIIRFREDELNHKDIAYEKGATKEGCYSIFDKIIKTGSKIAINISEKI